MTFEELKQAEKLAAGRDDALKIITAVTQAKFFEGFHHAPCPMAFGYRLDEDAVEALRRSLIALMEGRVASVEHRLKTLGVVFPEPVVMPRPPASWDPATREFTFTIGSTAPMRGSRRLPMGTIDVDETLSGEGYVPGPKLPPIQVEGRRGSVRIGDVVRVWTEDGQILGRGRLLEEASTACAAVASGAVRDVHAFYDAYEESVVQREGQRPLVTMVRWHLMDVALVAPDVEDLGKLDPLPAKEEPTYEVDVRVGGATAVKAKMKTTAAEAARRAANRGL